MLALTLRADEVRKTPESAASSLLIEIEGTVELLDAKTGAWKAAGSNQTLSQGQRLRTGRNSRAALRLSESSVLRIGELTTVVIEKPAAQKAKSLLDIKSGSVYFFSREKPEDIQLRTPVVAGAIRGTEFTVE